MMMMMMMMMMMRRRRRRRDRIRICEGTLALVRVQPCFFFSFVSMQYIVCILPATHFRTGFGILTLPVFLFF
jgi:hypothetical protein